MFCFPCRLMLITDYRYIDDKDMGKTIGSAVRGGVDLVQYRDKGADYPLRIKRAKVLRGLTSDLGARLVINSDIDIAGEVGADGIHFPVNFSLADIPEKKTFFFGFSAHNKEEIKRGESLGADYLLVSPLFNPGSKSVYFPTLGERGLKKLCNKTAPPIFALGGINEGNIGLAVKCGAYGVASVTGLLLSKDIFESAKRMREVIDKG